MLSTTLLHALPDAFESDVDPHHLFATLLAGLLTFFLVEKFALLHHGRRHGQRNVLQSAGYGKPQYGHASGTWIIVVGDAMHNFTDGVMIAAAFLADPGLGIATALAILAHEIPQEVNNFIILLNAGYSRKRAFLFNLLCSLMAALGGMLGFLALGHSTRVIPYVLAFASAGFIYLALSHLVPQLQRRETLHESAPQVILISLGVGIVLLITRGT
jgi:zinc and cadmium transporter